MAITWRNIEAPDLRGVGALMGQANAGITNMGNAFQTALTDWNTNQQKKVDEQKTQNTDAFLNNTIISTHHNNCPLRNTYIGAILYSTNL